MSKEILKLIALAYWQNHNDCGADFDKDRCRGDDFGECPDFEFCQLYQDLIDKC